MNALGHRARTHSARGHGQNTRTFRRPGNGLGIALAGAALIGAAPGAAGAQALVSNLSPPATTTDSAASAQNAPTPQTTQKDKFFVAKLFDAYVDEFTQPPPAPASQTAEAPLGRRPDIPPAPLASPPWAWADWPLGGTQLLGGATPNSSGNNLMKALDGTPVGDFLKDNHVEIWGWVDAGFNVSTSKGKNGNAPAGYDFNANAIQLNQAVMYIERVPDTVQQDHIDWGFRVVGLYGTDYREVTMEGIFSNRLTQFNALYGATPVNFYVDLYIPWVGQGSTLRVGRYTTLGDIEADLDMQNVFDTHAMYYTYDPFTQFGAVWSTRLNKNWTVQIGLNAGSDVAPWEKDAKPTVTSCVQWSSDNSWDTVYVCANGTNNAKYGFNNVNLYQFMWYHKFTDRLWVATEDYYEYERDVPTATIPGANPALISGGNPALIPGGNPALSPVANPAPIANPALIPGANPALCRTGTQCWAGAYAASLYVMYRLTDRDYVGIRNEAFDDVRGQRTGFTTWYSENTLGWVHWLSNSIEVRPEIRYDHSYDAAAYDNGARRSQFAFATDVLVKF